MFKKIISCLSIIIVYFIISCAKDFNHPIDSENRSVFRCVLP